VIQITTNGFRFERVTSQHVLAARTILEENKDSLEGRPVAIFIDYSKAFDSVKWTWIRVVLLHYNVPEELVESVYVYVLRSEGIGRI
jgi:hypothetical protein